MIWCAQKYVILLRLIRDSSQAMQVLNRNIVVTDNKQTALPQVARSQRLSNPRLRSFKHTQKSWLRSLKRLNWLLSRTCIEKRTCSQCGQLLRTSLDAFGIPANCLEIFETQSRSKAIRSLCLDGLGVSAHSICIVPEFSYRPSVGKMPKNLSRYIWPRMLRYAEIAIGQPSWTGT